MTIDFYHWGNMCPITKEIMQLLDEYNEIFIIHVYDISKDDKLAKRYNIYFPFLTIVNGCKRYYAPITASFLDEVKKGIMPIEKPY